MNRFRLRAALQIRQQYASRPPTESPSGPPVELWRQVEQTWRQLLLCRNHQFQASEKVIRERYLQRLDRLSRRCRDQVATSAFVATAALPTLRMLLEELTALESEFSDVHIDLARKTLSVITDRVNLEGIELGPFEICLYWSRIDQRSPFEVIALEPHPACDSSATTHPHVLDQTLCEGEAREAIQSTLQEGRLSDLFLLISRVLQTYNPGSAYTKLSEWEGCACPDCGDHVASETGSHCDQCDSACCEDCLQSCRECGNSCCSHCERLCDGCQDPHCGDCLQSCEACADSVCAACRIDNLCSDCHDHQQECFDEEFDDETEDSITETTPPSPPEANSSAEADIHTDRLGTASVPA